MAIDGNLPIYKLEEMSESLSDHLTEIDSEKYEIEQQMYNIEEALERTQSSLETIATNLENCQHLQEELDSFISKTKNSMRRNND